MEQHKEQNNKDKSNYMHKEEKNYKQRRRERWDDRCLFHQVPEAGLTLDSLRVSIPLVQLRVRQVGRASPMEKPRLTPATIPLSLGRRGTPR